MSQILARSATGGNPASPRIVCPEPASSEPGPEPAILNGFAQIPHQVAADPRLSPIDVRVALALLRYACASGSCWPSNAAIGKYVHASDDTVQRSLRSLRAAGYIRCERIKPQKGNMTGRVIFIYWKSVQDTARMRQGVPHGCGGGYRTDAAGGTARMPPEKEVFERERNKEWKTTTELSSSSSISSPSPEEDSSDPAATELAKVLEAAEALWDPSETLTRKVKALVKKEGALVVLSALETPNLPGNDWGYLLGIIKNQKVEGPCVGKSKKPPKFDFDFAEHERREKEKKRTRLRELCIAPERLTPIREQFLKSLDETGRRARYDALSADEQDDLVKAIVTWKPDEARELIAERVGARPENAPPTPPVSPRPADKPPPKARQFSDPPADFHTFKPIGHVIDKPMQDARDMQSLAGESVVSQAPSRFAGPLPKGCEVLTEQEQERLRGVPERTRAQVFKFLATGDAILAKEARRYLCPSMAEKPLPESIQKQDIAANN